MDKLLKNTFALLLAVIGLTFAQPGSGGRTRDSFSPDIFQIRLFCSTLPEKRPQACVDTYIRFANDVLTFIKTDSSTWQARFDLELLIYNSKHEIAAYNTIRDTVTVNRFELTNSRIDPLTKTARFYLQPGDYSWRLKLLNAEGLPVLDREERLKVPDYGPDQLQMSDIYLADSLDCAADTYAINLSGIFKRQNGAMGALFELYPPAGLDSMRCVLSLTDASARKVMEKKITLAAEPIIHYCLDLGNDITRPGEYTLQVRASAGSRSIQSEQKIRVLWGSADVPKESVNLAIEQLGLIARGNTIREIQRAQGVEKQKLYDSFWEKRDPTPGTPENELKIEFFLRIDFANDQFTEARSGRQGWRTDRGRIFIQNGTPDHIEKQVGETGVASVEIWQYSSVNRRYIFVDRLNNGEFRLAKIE